MPDVRNKSELVKLVEEAAERIASGSDEHFIVSPPASPEELAAMIDHTLLKPTATESQIRALCNEAAEFGFATVCVNPVWVTVCARELANSAAKVCTVIGFPLGATTTAAKVFEAEQCAGLGARELDMVINIGALQAGDFDTVFTDIAAVAEASHRSSALLKVIIETAYLTEAEKIAACAIAKRAGADFVKTSTGFGPSGATTEDVRLMRRVVGSETGVKAAGGIRSLADANAMIAAGANRIGSSSGVNIIREARALNDAPTVGH